MPRGNRAGRRIPVTTIRHLTRQNTAGFFIALLITVLTLFGIHWLAPVPNIANEPPSNYYVATDGDDTNDGSSDHPWATLNHAAVVAYAGDTVYLKGGIYALTAPVRPTRSGTADRPITYAAAPGEHAILDAQQIPVPAPSGKPPFAHDQGAFQLENVDYIRVRDLEVINSHNAGFTVRNSGYVQLYNNTTNNTFSSGIALWGGHHHQVMGNTIMNANLPKLTDYERDDTQATPHEAISLGDVEYFEVAYNNIHNSAKEGIDIKQTSSHGTVHHNHVHHVDRQGLYVDSWFGVLDDVELYDNIVHHCKGGGFMVSAEGGKLASNIRFHHNLIYDNWGTGIFLSRWGQDRLRKHLEIYNNTVYHNGFGPPNPGDEFYWITGGLYLFSTQLEDVAIHHNILGHNTAFQLGYSDRYLQNSAQTNPPSNIQTIFEQKQIRISDNIIAGDNDTENPVYAGWAPDDYADIYGTEGKGAIATFPPFIDTYHSNFYLERTDSDQKSDRPDPDNGNIGAFPISTEPSFWWEGRNFPPVLDFDPAPFE